MQRDVGKGKVRTMNDEVASVQEIGSGSFLNCFNRPVHELRNVFHSYCSASLSYLKKHSSKNMTISVAVKPPGTSRI